MQLVKYFRKYKTFWWGFDIPMIISYEGALLIFVYFTKMHLYLYSVAWGSIREQACDDLLAGALFISSVYFTKMCICVFVFCGDGGVYGSRRVMIC